MKNKKFIQKEIWKMVLDMFKSWEGFHHAIHYGPALEEALNEIEFDNSIKIPIEWRWKFRKRINHKSFKRREKE